MTPSADPARDLHWSPRSSAPRSLRRPCVLLLAPGLAALCLLVSACGGSSASGVAQLGANAATRQSTSSTAASANSGSTDAERMLAFSRCVRAHGVSNYPDPDSSGHLPPGGKQIARSNGDFPAAQNACMHLLASGTATLRQRQQKLAFAVKLAQCMRGHGFPTFPDPNASGQHLPAGIDPNSPQFEAAETTCHEQAQQAVGLP